MLLLVVVGITGILNFAIYFTSYYKIYNLIKEIKSKLPSIYDKYMVDDLIASFEEQLLIASIESSLLLDIKVFNKILNEED